MNTESLFNSINSQEDLLKIKDESFQNVLESFPYFQSARLLYLKKLKLEKNYKFNDELKIAAAYSADRTVLFDFITSEKKEDLISIEVEDEIIPKVKPEKVKEKLHQSLEFNKSDRHSFNEWLQLSNVKALKRKEEIHDDNKTIKSYPDLKKKSKFELIDKFISTNPKLKPKQKKDSPNTNISLSSTRENEGLMTETLAQVYVEQKKYSKAIKAYKILGLKYPEKSGFFADRIRAIKKIEAQN